MNNSQRRLLLLLGWFLGAPLLTLALVMIFVGISGLLRGSHGGDDAVFLLLAIVPFFLGALPPFIGHFFWAGRDKED